jgi:hypothetical protein
MFLERYDRDGNVFLNQIVTGDETWISRNSPTNKLQSMTDRIYIYTLVFESGFVLVKFDVCYKGTVTKGIISISVCCAVWTKARPNSAKSMYELEIEFDTANILITPLTQRSRQDVGQCE